MKGQGSSHLGSKWDQGDALSIRAVGITSLTFGVAVEFCSETKWASCDVRRDSKHEVPRKGFERLLRLFARHEFVVWWKDVSEPTGRP